MKHLTELIDEEKCLQLIEQWRWPEGVRCPHCKGRQDIVHTRNYRGRDRRYLNKACQRTVTSCTQIIFAQSRVSLRTSFARGYLLNCRLSS